MSTPYVLELPNSAGNILRVEFTQEGDRFFHAISEIRGGEIVPLLQSLEGDAEMLFPPSPPFAELHQQGKTFFLTGATQAGHWSMSVQPEGKSVLFDAACRLKQSPQWLGNKYQIADTSNFDLTCEEHCISQVCGDQLCIGCEVTEDMAVPATLRWRYRIAVKQD